MDAAQGLASGLDEEATEDDGAALSCPLALHAVR